MAKLVDDKVLKVGIHIRHLPFVVRDENGVDSIEKRGLRCLSTTIATHLAASASKYPNGCLILVATNMNVARDSLLSKIARLESVRCIPFMVRRTSNTSTGWGGRSYTATGKRGIQERILAVLWKPISTYSCSPSTPSSS